MGKKKELKFEIGDMVLHSPISIPAAYGFKCKYKDKEYTTYLLKGGELVASTVVDIVKGMYVLSDTGTCLWTASHLVLIPEDPFVTWTKEVRAKDKKKGKK